MPGVGPYAEEVLIQLGINLVLALSLYFPLSAGQLSLGQAGFMAIGAYVSAWLTAVGGWPWVPAFAAGMAAAGAAGLLVGLPALRVRGISLVLLTLAFGEIVRVFFLNFAPTGGAQGLRGVPFVTTLPLVAGAAALALWVAARTAASRMGRAFAAIEADELAAEVAGVDVARAKLVAFAVGAVVAGLAGALWAHYIQFLEPEEFGFQRSVLPFMFVVVGGLETYWGAVAGAAVLTLLPEWLRFLREWRLAFYGVMMVLMMIVRPQGLVDRRMLDAIARGGRRMRYRWLAIVLALAVVAGGAVRPAPAAPRLAGKAAKLGAIYSITGKGAEWGEHSKIATDIAVEEINAAGGVGGVPLQVLVADTGTEVGPTISLARKLVLEDKVLALLGPCFSSEFEALAPLLDRLRTMMVSQCSSKPGISALSQWAFRNTLTSDKQLDPAVRIWKDRYHIRTAVIIYDAADAVSSSEGKDVLPVLLKKYGVDVKDSLTYQTKDLDVSAQITRARALNPDGIALGACYQQAANLVREARKQGLKQPFLASACTGSPEFARLVGKDGEGTIIGSTGWADDPRPKVVAFTRKFMERSGGRKPNYGALHSYDDVYIMKQVIETSGVTNRPEDLDADRERIRDGWTHVKDFDGVTGPTTINAERDGAGKPTVLTVRGGTLVRVEY